MKRLYLLVLSIILVAGLHAQTIEQIKADRYNYFWGEGSGVTLNRADQEAVAMLISQISVHVEASFTHLFEDTGTAGKDSYREVFDGVINTYSSATLRNTERITISNEPDARVFRYIRRAEVDRIFAERERKIRDFFLNGRHSCESGRVADALRYYYWALTLLRSHPNGGSIAMTDDSDRERLLITWLPLLINDVFSNLSVSVETIRNEHGLMVFVLNVLYGGKPAVNFDYSYWTGRDWTNIFSARDGLGIAEFSETTDIAEISFRAEYIFEGETAIDNELRDVMLQLEIIPFRNSYFNVPASQAATRVVKHDSLQATYVTEVADAEPYEAAMRVLVEAVRRRDHSALRHLFTSEGYDMYQKLLQYGQARILREPELQFVEFEGGVICRSIPMSFHFSNNDRTFVEDVVFHFDDQGLISSLAFGLGEVALADIMGRDVWSERVRMVLVNFMESYKTAYALKRLDYIESIFADDALIITGTVLKSKGVGEMSYMSNPIVRYNRLTKEEFLRRLRHSFVGNEFINIRFEDNEVRKSGRGGEIYGIQIKQDYFSSNYGDTGYLFLMVDFNDPDQPLIYVRTWQPEKNPDGTIYGLGDFN